LVRRAQEWGFQEGVFQRFSARLEAENDGFQYESPFPGANFKVPCLTSGV